MKPKLLISAGYPSSGTTSLYYTLWSNKYGHGGHWKENQYLMLIQSPHLFEVRKRTHKNRIKFGEGVVRPWDLPENIFALDAARVQGPLRSVVPSPKEFRWPPCRGSC